MMNDSGLRFLILVVLMIVGIVTPTMGTENNYPEARREKQADIYHGVKVMDPYRWLEEMTSAETTSWIDRQETYFQQQIESSELFETLHRRVVSIGTHEQFRFPKKVGDKIFYLHRAKGQERPALMVQSLSSGQTKTLIPAGTSTIWGFQPSPDGRFLTFKRRQGGSQWGTLQILDVEKQKVLKDEIPDYYGNGGRVVWLPDGNAFFYVNFERSKDQTKLGAEVKGAKVFRHELGTSAQRDYLIYAQPEKPSESYNLSISDDQRFLVMAYSEGASIENGVLLLDLNSRDAVPQSFLKPTAAFRFLGNQGKTFWFQTDRNAPRGKVVAIDLDNPAEDQWQTLIPESSETLQSVVASGGYFATLITRDARVSMNRYRADGKALGEVKLPFLGNVWSMGGTPSTDKEIYFRISGLFHPGAIYSLNLQDGQKKRMLEPKLNFQPGDYTMSQVFYRSSDGTRIPMFLAHRKGLKPNPETPVFMYGYGAYGWSAFPWFQAHMVAWLDLGGVYAMPGIRGGGEYGTAWHQAGIKLNKRTGVADYLAAAQWLITQGWTSPKNLVANGGSASGLLPAAAINQKPELFGAAVIDIPTLDLLRFDRFGLGQYRLPEYGSPKIENEFKVLHSLSPYHNLKKEVCYPSVLVTVGERDETAVPMHGYKYIAKLQHLQACENQALLKVVRGAGHTFGTTPAQNYHTMAGQLTFLAKVLKIEAQVRSFGMVSMD